LSEVVIVIPARYGATRLPGKPLLDLAGKPLIAHTIARAKAFDGASVIVATDDPRIADVASSCGVRALMTRGDHQTGTDRLAECAEMEGWRDDVIVVNLQGDEPLMPISALRAVVHELETHRRASLATLATPIVSVEQLFDPACVKVVLRQDGRALYFSRAPIPWARDAFAKDQSQLPQDVTYWRHLGVYAYRVGALKQLAGLPQSMLEKAESLEQLRALELGFDIQVGIAPEAIPQGVDTPADLQRLEREMLLSEVKTINAPRAPKDQQISHARKLLMVCLGNICRSPLSAVYAQKRGRELGFSGLEIESRGTKARNSANAPADLRTQAIARTVQLDLRAHRARALVEEDFYRFDLLLAHDEQNLADMQAVCPPGMEHKLRLLMSFATDAPRQDVPDPYLGDHEDFILAWQLAKLGIDGLMKELSR
jgi:3-deoxy-manno-octulosonate cytidylyltransferase (CMP-KDO synthetase)